MSKLLMNYWNGVGKMLAKRIPCTPQKDLQRCSSSSKMSKTMLHLLKRVEKMGLNQDQGKNVMCLTL
jgi:hypothetical protein